MSASFSPSQVFVKTPVPGLSPERTALSLYVLKFVADNGDVWKQTISWYDLLEFMDEEPLAPEHMDYDHPHDRPGFEGGIGNALTQMIEKGYFSWANPQQKTFHIEDKFIDACKTHSAVTV